MSGMDEATERRWYRWSRWGDVGLGVYVRPWGGGRPYYQPLGDRCWKCDNPKPDIAHMIFEYVAAILGAELSARVYEAEVAHVAAHGCAWGCPEVIALIDLLPVRLQPIGLG